MRRFYEIDNYGAQYWVIANSEEEAMGLVRALDEHEEDGEPMTSEEITYQMDRFRKMKFVMEGEGECSMYLAYLLVRDHASTVLACSEWP